MPEPRIRAILTATLAVLLVHASVTGIAAAEVSHDPDPAELVAAPAPCTVRIPAEVEEIDGTRPEIGPGAVICLVAGTRGNLKLSSVRGMPDAPITVRNDGGVVVITGTRFEAGIYIQDSTYLRITGSGVGEACGARHAPSAQACGIVIDGARKGIKVATNRGEARGLEIDHVAIARVADGAETRGIAIHPVDRQVITGIRIHDNHIANTGAEAVYIGSEPRQKPFEELGKVDRVEVAHNLIEEIGWDAIKMKVALSGSSIHHNVIRNVGLANYAAHRGGVTVATSAVTVHHNVIVGAPEGIRTGRPLEGAQNRFHDNVIADTVLVAIDTKDPGAVIANNTIVGGEGVGIRARGAGSVVIDNIVTDKKNAITEREGVTIRGNLVGEVVTVGFVDPAGGDFRLAEDSPAVGRGRIADVTLCRRGIKARRPVPHALGLSTPESVTGCRSNLGAEVDLLPL